MPLYKSVAWPSYWPVLAYPFQKVIVELAKVLKASNKMNNELEWFILWKLAKGIRLLSVRSLDYIMWDRAEVYKVMHGIYLFIYFRKLTGIVSLFQNFLVYPFQLPCLPLLEKRDWPFLNHVLYRIITFPLDVCNNTAWDFLRPWTPWFAARSDEKFYSTPLTSPSPPLPPQDMEHSLSSPPWKPKIMSSR